MSRASGGIQNILYDCRWGLELPGEVQIQRIRRVMEEELTARQRMTLEAYYFDGLSPAQIARQQGVCRSTVLRSIQRAEDRIRRHLIY